MSPRRMDISSLLRDPSPPPPPPHPPSSSSLLSILNDTQPPPFLGLDALVHVAFEERRRITASNHARTTYHPPDPFHNASSSHKRPRDPSPPRSPSPPLPSPSSHLHQSASPVNLYPTLRRQPALHLDPTRSAQPLFDDSRSLPHSSFQLSSPFPHSPTPHNSSPHRHSPHHFRSHLHSSPVLPQHDLDSMSPRYGHGPRMAGGIEILSNDSSSRPDLSNFHSPRRDISTERLVLESHSDHPRPESLKLSPPSARGRLFSLDDARLLPRQPETPDRVRSYPAHSPSPPVGPTTTLPPRTADFRPLERHPIRVWEEQPSRVSQHIPGILCSPPSWLRTADSAPEPSQYFAKVPTPPLPVCEVPRVPSRQLPDSQAPIRRFSFDSQTPVQPRLPDPHRSSLPSTSQHHQYESQPERSGIQAEADIPSTDPIITESILDSAVPISRDADADVQDIHHPSPRPVPAEELESETFDTSVHPTLVDASQNASRSPSQPALPLPAKDEPAPSDTQPEVSLPEPEDTSERNTMADVDEELLSLVEDRPVRVSPTMPKVQIEPTSSPPIVEDQDGVKQGSSETPDGSSLISSSQTLKGPPLFTDEDKDRASMPPPPARTKKAEKDKTTGNKKKKDGTSKPAAKPKQPSKPRAKPAPKTKLKPSVADALPKGTLSLPKAPVTVNARSRSTSVIPGVVDDTVLEPDAVDSDKEDDKLYCICKTRYDEDRMMIACDRCDEWFHTLCVDMPDLEIELVDQFICPPCIQKHPQMRTTWKRRCLFGLEHENPSLPEACHRPSRGAFSKYCSDECGVKYMRARIARWEMSGGVRDLLWESAKNAAKREGVVVCVQANGTVPAMVVVDGNHPESKPLDSAAKRRAGREVGCLNVRLEEVVKERELMKRELDMVTWREKVVELASQRAGKVDECGWDQRLCFGEEEWADFGLEVLESYEEERVKVESSDDAMPVDGASAIHGEWWCTGKKKCERHAGWQKLRTAEVSFDKETKEGILLKLTTREREIRKRIEDLLYPQPTGALQAPSKPAHLEIQINGFENLPSVGHVSERGKKRT